MSILKRASFLIAFTALLCAIFGGTAAARTVTVQTGQHDWSGVVNCESGGNWKIDTGNGFHGGLQFTQGTWEANGGSGNPANASPSEQIRVAENVLNTQGIRAWPVCGKYLAGGTTTVEEETEDTPPAPATPQPSTPQDATPPASPPTSIPDAIQQVTNFLNVIAPSLGLQPVR